MNEKLKLRGRIGRFVQWPLYLSILLIIFNVLVYLADIQAGLVMSLGICLYLLVAVPLARRSKPAILNELIAFANQYDQVEKRILDELALPYAVMDMNGNLIWNNRVFSDLTGKDQYTKKISAHCFRKSLRTSFQRPEPRNRQN